MYIICLYTYTLLSLCVFFTPFLYNEYCVYWSINGFFMSQLFVASPHCQFLRWLLYNSGKIVTNLWIVLLGITLHWLKMFVSKFIIRKTL